MHIADARRQMHSNQLRGGANAAAHGAIHSCVLQSMFCYALQVRPWSRGWRCGGRCTSPAQSRCSRPESQGQLHVPSALSSSRTPREARACLCSNCTLLGGLKRVSAIPTLAKNWNTWQEALLDIIGNSWHRTTFDRVAWRQLIALVRT